MDGQKEASVKGETNMGIWRQDGNISNETQLVTELQCYLSVMKNRAGAQTFAKCLYNAPSTKFYSYDE